MEIIFWNDKSSARCRHIMKLETGADRYAYLLKNEVSAGTWMNTKTMKEFYRPKLNGITVTPKKTPFIEFKTPAAAVKEGEKIRRALRKFLDTKTNS